MKVALDADVQAVLEFMQENVPTSKLLGVASALHAIAPILWGRYESAPIQAIALESNPFSISCERQPIATG
jgi:hypothetical protein